MTLNPACTIFGLTERSSRRIKEDQVFKKGDFVNKRYEVVRKTGSGGTSSVYLVADRHIGRSLAMKVMDKRSMGAFRFARSEIEMLRRVRFPLFPQIIDAFCDDHHIYILSEFVKGESLAKLSAGHAMSRHRSLALLARICEALVYLHEMSTPMLYLDLKPENVIISPDGLPHLIDFGIAQLLFTKHIPVGTRGYSPPEQYDPDIMPDVRADIFALGMTYWSMRSGIPPDPDLTKALNDIRHSRSLSSSERAFILKCCDPSRDRRYGTSREVLKKIQHIRSIPDRFKKNIALCAALTGTVLSAAFITKNIVTEIRERTEVTNLLSEATKHMEDGEYTPEGIGLIRACIDSGNLSHECEQEFMFEVARNLMLIRGDYKTAAIYFSKLDEGVYPEAADYLSLCRLESRPDHDGTEAMKTVGRIFADISGRSPSKMKYENMIFIARCFEMYDPDRVTGAKKSLSVLAMEMEELDELSESCEVFSEDEIDAMRDRLKDLMDVGRKRINTRSKMIGENDENEDK